MDIDADGATLVPQMVGEHDRRELLGMIGEPGRAGIRLTARKNISDWVSRTGLAAKATEFARKPAIAVRTTLFDKTEANNWALGWHQDRTIAVARRHAVAGYHRWTVKQGVTHVEPPFAILEAMLTARVHLDEVDEANAPLRIIPGSHRLGLIRESDVEAVVQTSDPVTCLARPGDVWWYRTPILHASSASEARVSRRVLQIDFSAERLPHPLAWAGEV